MSRTLRLNRMSADSIPASLRLRGHLAATWRVMCGKRGVTASRKASIKKLIVDVKREALHVRGHAQHAA